MTQQMTIDRLQMLLHFGRLPEEAQTDVSNFEYRLLGSDLEPVDLTWAVFHEVLASYRDRGLSFGPIPCLARPMTGTEWFIGDTRRQ